MKAIKEEYIGDYIRGLGKTADKAVSALLIFLSILIVLPIVFIFAISFSSEESIVKNGYRLIPKEWSLDAYRYLIKSLDYILHSLGVTVIVTIAGTLLSLFLISTMAYVLSREDFRLRKIYTILILLPMFFGGGLAATYAVNTQLYGLKNTLLALIIPGACSSWYIIVMRTYYSQNIPREILEAAELDGASVWRIFWQFVLPLSKPIIVTIGTLEAFSYWNSWYPNMLYTDSNHSDLYTLQYVLYNLEKSASFLATNERISGAVAARIPTESYRMALAVIIMIPVLATYPLFRKFYVKGLTTGAGK
ncbi:MAG: carbohydrate ABC transporter permease [Lachnospiraceae bacterium]|nr:carbohydrate ABC transporter permease [Lachnospiraceae bacterium]